MWHCPPSISIYLDGHGTDKHHFWLHLGPNKASGGSYNHRESLPYLISFHFSFDNLHFARNFFTGQPMIAMKV
jgi:hypothetical protein